MMTGTNDTAAVLIEAERIASDLLETDALTGNDENTPTHYTVHADNVTHLVRTVLDLAVQPPQDDPQDDERECDPTCAPHLHMHCTPECEADCESCSRRRDPDAGLRERVEAVVETLAGQGPRLRAGTAVPLLRAALAEPTNEGQ